MQWTFYSTYFGYSESTYQLKELEIGHGYGVCYTWLMLDVPRAMPLQNTALILEQECRAVYLLEARIYRIGDEHNYDI